MKKIYIINSILNFILAILAFIPFMSAITSINFANYKGGILMLILIVLAVLISNFMLFILMNNYSKKIKYKIRKKLYRLISLVTFLGTLLIEMFILSII